MEQLIEDIERQYGKEKAEKVRDVVVVVTAKVQAKNLFGWRSFLEDALVETISWIIRTEFQYSGGAYVACGMQSAIDHCRYCNAKKRRQDYEMLSLDDEESTIQVAESDDAKIPRAEFFAPPISTSPTNGFPPFIKYCSILHLKLYCVVLIYLIQYPKISESCNTSLADQLLFL